MAHQKMQQLSPKEVGSLDEVDHISPQELFSISASPQHRNKAQHRRNPASACGIAKSREEDDEALHGGGFSTMKRWFPRTFIPLPTGLPIVLQWCRHRCSSCRNKSGKSVSAENCETTSQKKVTGPLVSSSSCFRRNFCGHFSAIFVVIFLYLVLYCSFSQHFSQSRLLVLLKKAAVGLQARVVVSSTTSSFDSSSSDSVRRGDEEPAPEYNIRDQILSRLKQTLDSTASRLDYYFSQSQRTAQNGNDPDRQSYLRGQSPTDDEASSSSRTSSARSCSEPFLSDVQGVLWPMPQKVVGSYHNEQKRNFPSHEEPHDRTFAQSQNKNHVTNKKVTAPLFADAVEIDIQPPPRTRNTGAEDAKIKDQMMWLRKSIELRLLSILPRTIPSNTRISSTTSDNVKNNDSSSDKQVIKLKVQCDSYEFPARIVDEHQQVVAGGDMMSPKNATRNQQELYHLEIRQSSISVTQCNSVLGPINAVSTLLTLLTCDQKNTLCSFHFLGSSKEQQENDEDSYLAITDWPIFPYRGLMVDVSRSFITIPTLKEIIELLALVKMNVLHLHLTDSHAWPLQIDEYPFLTELGAYNAETKVYSRREIRDLVEFGKLHGVRLLPEIDGPAHAPAALGDAHRLLAGAGDEGVVDEIKLEQQRQLSELYKNYGKNSYGRVVQCTGPGFQNSHWAKEPPAGQWNLRNPNTTKILGAVWRQVSQDFSTAPSLHLGVDEVMWKCTCLYALEECGLLEEGKENSLTFQARKDLMLAASYDRDPRTQKYVAAEVNHWIASLSSDAGGAANAQQRPFLQMWQDSVLEYDVELRSPNRTILQLWNFESSKEKERLRLQHACKRGVWLVQASYKRNYLDCGSSHWLVDGRFWCEYASWLKIYDQDISGGVDDGGPGIPSECRDRFLGASVQSWGEMIDNESIVKEVFPRVFALAERLWFGHWSTTSPGFSKAHPRTRSLSSWLHALKRLRRLVLNVKTRGHGIGVLQPEYCVQHPEICDEYTVGLMR